MDLETLYSLHKDPSQLFGSDIYPYKEFMDFLPERYETLHETGEIMNQRLKELIKIMPHRDAKVEKFILTPDDFTADLVIPYAGFVIKKRWPEGEKIIIDNEDGYTARRYALMFNFRFKEAEAVIAEYAENSFNYTVDTLEKPWRDVGLPQYEKSLKQNIHHWQDYCNQWNIDPDEHWIAMNEMIKEHNKQCQEIADRQKLSDEDWYRRFTI